MKINWGVFAFSLFGVFVVFMLSLVYFATKQNNELVTENYYEKELEFQEVLVKKENTLKLSEKVTFEINSESMVISFPKEITEQITGKLFFYKPSNEKFDKDIAINTIKNTQQIVISEFQKGMYRVKVDWKANGVDYYNETSIVIP